MRIVGEKKQVRTFPRVIRVNWNGAGLFNIWKLPFTQNILSDMVNINIKDRKLSSGKIPIVYFACDQIL